MKKSQWLLLGLSLLVLVPLAAQQGNLLQPKSSIAVRDSKGKPMGVMIDAHLSQDATPIPVVLFKAGQQFITLGARPDNLVGNSWVLLFTTSDCSGTPYFQSTGASLIADSFVTNDGTLYISRAGAPVETFYIASYYWREENFPNPQPCRARPFAIGPIQVVAAQAEGNVYQMFQPPFSLR
jgi:hypothetical protein